MSFRIFFLLGVLLVDRVQAESVRVTVSGHYEYVGAAPSPTADFTLSFTIDRHPLVCGGSIGASLVCGASRPTYDNGTVHAVLGEPSLLFRDAGEKGGLELFQDDLQFNRLGFIIGSSQLWTGTLTDLTLLDGTFDICPGHQGQAHPEYMSELCSYAGQGFASGDPVNNPFNDPVTLQSDNPILAGTIHIEGIIEPPPTLMIAISTGSGQVTLRWLKAAGFVLEQSIDAPGGPWIPVTEAPTLEAGMNSLIVPIDSARKFFRLHQP